MRAHRPNCRILIALVAGTLLLAGSTKPVRAQLGAIGGPTGPAIEALPPQSGRPSELEERGQAENALVAGDWLLYPTAFAGGIYDSNPAQSALNPRASGGIRLVPAILAERTAAISRTSLYAMTDARVYAIGETQGVDAVAARLGAIEDYEPADSWVVHAQGDYTRQRDIFSTLGVTNNLLIAQPHRGRRRADAGADHVQPVHRHRVSDETVQQRVRQSRRLDGRHPLQPARR